MHVPERISQCKFWKENSKYSGMVTYVTHVIGTFIIEIRFEIYFLFIWKLSNESTLKQDE